MTDINRYMDIFRRELEDENAHLEDAVRAALSAALAESAARLEEAIEIAEEGWSYAGDYFRKKWDADARLRALRHL